LTRRRRQHFVEGKYYRVNEEIRAPEIRVIHSKEGQLGILSREDALKRAQEADLDLVEVAPGVKPPVAKLIDFAKFKYDQAKKKKASKAAFTETKQLRLRPFMDEHDIQVRLKKIEKFLKNGSRVKIKVRFFGREITKKKFGFELINNIMSKLGESAKLHEEPKLKGKTIEALIIPKT
jgi:translation initiation factor IF-3